MSASLVSVKTALEYANSEPLQTASLCSEKELRIRRCPSPMIDEIYATGKIWKLDGSQAPLNVFIPREEGDYLYSLVRELRPERTLEVGMANGLSTLFIAQALLDNGAGHHMAVDPFQRSDWHGAGLAIIHRAGLESLVTLIELPSHQALPELERQGVAIDFAFVDGSHQFDYVVSDFLCIDRILRIGGLIAFDDSDWPAIIKALRFVLSNRRYEVAYPDVVIEQAKYNPGLLSRSLRYLSRHSAGLRRALCPAFVRPSFEIGIRGRCVVLRKLAADDRDSQASSMLPF